MSQHTDELSALGQMLADFVDRVPGVAAAVLVTADGLVNQYAGLSETDADTIAAGISGIASLSSGIFLGAPGRVQQTAVEHDSGTFFIMRADGPEQVPNMVGALLAVRTSSTADPGVVGYEMLQWIDRMRTHLQDPVRTTPAAPAPSAPRLVQ
ncbi:roadblock/LC7 domain-containing protein [Streptomyces sp. NPDC057837]|uniref:roadblock/LC7 domain-containing protein n=1 Tax=Streptomyces sp. NPDC057837 TaxID=3346260 RepID=UPI0036C47B59